MPLTQQQITNLNTLEQGFRTLADPIASPNTPPVLRDNYTAMAEASKSLTEALTSGEQASATAAMVQLQTLQTQAQAEVADNPNAKAFHERVTQQTLTGAAATEIRNIVTSSAPSAGAGTGENTENESPEAKARRKLQQDQRAEWMDQGFMGMIMALVDTMFGGFLSNMGITDEMVKDEVARQQQEAGTGTTADAPGTGEPEVTPRDPNSPEAHQQENDLTAQDREAISDALANLDSRTTSDEEMWLSTMVNDDRGRLLNGQIYIDGQHIIVKDGITEAEAEKLKEALLEQIPESNAALRDKIAAMSNSDLANMIQYRQDNFSTWNGDASYSVLDQAAIRSVQQNQGLSASARSNLGSTLLELDQNSTDWWGNDGYLKHDGKEVNLRDGIQAGEERNTLLQAIGTKNPELAQALEGMDVNQLNALIRFNPETERYDIAPPSATPAGERPVTDTVRSAGS